MRTSGLGLQPQAQTGENEIHFLARVFHCGGKCLSYWAVLQRCSELFQYLGQARGNLQTTGDRMKGQKKGREEGGSRVLPAHLYILETAAVLTPAVALLHGLIGAAPGALFVAPSSLVLPDMLLGAGLCLLCRDIPGYRRRVPFQRGLPSPGTLLGAELCLPSSYGWAAMPAMA